MVFWTVKVILNQLINIMIYCYIVDIEVSVPGKEPIMYQQYMRYISIEKPLEMVVKMDAVEKMKDIDGTKTAKSILSISEEEYLNHTKE